MHQGRYTVFYWKSQEDCWGIGIERWGKGTYWCFQCSEGKDQWAEGKDCCDIEGIWWKGKIVWVWTGEDQMDQLGYQSSESKERRMGGRKSREEEAKVEGESRRQERGVDEAWRIEGGR
jgi:hypothetical protein